MIRKPIGNWQFAIGKNTIGNWQWTPGKAVIMRIPDNQRALLLKTNWQLAKIFVTCNDWQALPIAYCLLRIKIKNPLRNERVHHYEQS
jgi:hypothetical protein